MCKWKIQNVVVLEVAFIYVSKNFLLRFFERVDSVGTPFEIIISMKGSKFLMVDVDTGS